MFIAGSPDSAAEFVSGGPHHSPEALKAGSLIAFSAPVQHQGHHGQAHARIPTPGDAR
jgi:hypothetical protein